jgi:hypothetical protein
MPKLWTTFFNASTEIWLVMWWVTFYFVVPINTIHLGHVFLVYNIEWILILVVFTFFPYVILIPVNPHMLSWRPLIIGVPQLLSLLFDISL